MSVRRERRKRLKERLMREFGGKCQFCRCELSDHPTAGGTMQPNKACLFSVDDKFNPYRGTFPGALRTTLACRACCDRISTKRQAKQPIEELWRRSGRDADDDEMIELTGFATGASANWIGHGNSTPDCEGSNPSAPTNNKEGFGG